MGARTATRPIIKGSAPPVRRVGRRRPLPGSRSIVGGLLIGLAAVISFEGYTSLHRVPHQLYVVAIRSLVPGHRIGPGDVGLVPLNLPDPGVRRGVFGSTAALVGASVVTPIAAGSLVESSQVVGRGGPLGSREISLTLDRSRAVGGTLKPGEYVDVLATFGTGSESYTAVVVPHVRVLTLSSGGGAFGDNRSQLIVLAPTDATSAEALADDRSV